MGYCDISCSRRFEGPTSNAEKVKKTLMLFYDDEHKRYSIRTTEEFIEMAKTAKKKSEKKNTGKSVGFGYCSACGSRRKINGTCQLCGDTDSGTSKKDVPDRTSEDNPTEQG